VWQATNWRLAALGSTGLSALLALTWQSLPGAPASHPTSSRLIACMMHAPFMRPPARRLTRRLRTSWRGSSATSDRSQLIRLLVRSNWLDALNYVTDRGAQTLNDYARDADPFTKMVLGPSPSK